MKMIHPLLFTTFAALSLLTPLVNAETVAAAESQPAATDAEAEAEADQFYCAMQARYGLMQEQMGKIRQTRDPAERHKLMQEHWQTLHEGVGMMGRGFRMDPTMMGGYGMGPGMMRGGGDGTGPGTMGGGRGMGWQGLPGLSAEQQAGIAGIQDDTRRKHWELMATIMAEQARLRSLINLPIPDAAAINNARTKIGELQQQMYASVMDARKRMEAVLTQEQLEQLEQLRGYWQRGWHRGY